MTVQMAALEALDAAVVASGGEVITATDRQAAIVALDAMAEVANQVFPRMARAIANAQRVQAWLADDGFMAAVAAGTVVEERDEKGWSRGRFSAWVGHRYQWKPAYAKYMAAAGRVVGVLEATATAVAVPTGERQVRPLAKLLRYDDADDLISEVWNEAVELAEDEARRSEKDPSTLYAKKVAEVIAERKLKPTPSMEDRIGEVDRRIKSFRSTFRQLRSVMNRPDFEERVVAWLEEELR